MRMFKKKHIVIRGWHKGTLILLSYANPVVLPHGQEIDTIDRIEVSWETR